MSQQMKAQLRSLKQLTREQIEATIRNHGLDDKLALDAQFIVGEVIRSIARKVDGAGDAGGTQAPIAIHGDTLMNLMNGLIGTDRGAEEAVLRQVVNEALAHSAGMLRNSLSASEQAAVRLLDHLAVRAGAHLPEEPPPPAANTPPEPEVPVKSSRYYRGIRLG